MVLDSSAIVAILKGEPERDRFIDAIAEAGEWLLSAFNLFETRTVLLRRGGPDPLRKLATFLRAGRIGVHPFDEAQAARAFRAYERFRKGSGHKAQLTLGDCAAYALATSLDLPLLFKGEDFPRTDVRAALGS